MIEIVTVIILVGLFILNKNNIISVNINHILLINVLVLVVLINMIKNNSSYEHMTNTEAISNVASMMQSGNLTVTNLTVTGTGTVNNLNVSNTGAINSATINNLNVTDTGTVNKLTVADTGTINKLNVTQDTVVRGALVTSDISPRDGKLTVSSHVKITGLLGVNTAFNNAVGVGNNRYYFKMFKGDGYPRADSTGRVTGVLWHYSKDTEPKEGFNSDQNTMDNKFPF